MLITVLFPFCPQTDKAWSHLALMASSPCTSCLTCRSSEKRVTCQRHRCPSLLKQEGDGHSCSEMSNISPAEPLCPVNVVQMSSLCFSDIPHRPRHQTSQSHSSFHLDLLYFKRAEHHHLCDRCENMVTEVWRLTTDSNILMERQVS